MHPKFWRCFVFFATILVLANQHAEAAEAILAADLLKQADSLAIRGDYDEARSIFLKVAEDKTSPAAALSAKFFAAKCLFDKKDNVNYKQEAESLLQHHPDLATNHIASTKFMLGLVPFRNQDWEGTIAKMAEVVATDQETTCAARALAFQGDCLRRLRRFPEAREAFGKIKEVKHDERYLMEANHQSAHCLFDAGDLENFVKEAQALLKENPPADNRWVQMTKFHLAQVPAKQDKPLEAAEKIEAFIDATPDFRYIDLARRRCGIHYMHAADELRQAGKSEQAEACASKARIMFKALKENLESSPTNAGASETVFKARIQILETYARVGDVQGLMQSAQDLIGESAPQSREWCQGTLFLAVAKTQSTPPALDEAKKIFNDLITINFPEANPEFHTPTKAAFWLAYIAETQKDEHLMKLAIAKLQEMPDSRPRTDALKRFSQVTIESTTIKGGE